MLMKATPRAEGLGSVSKQVPSEIKEQNGCTNFRPTEFGMPNLAQSQFIRFLHLNVSNRQHGKLCEKKIQNASLSRWIKQEWTTFQVFIINITPIFNRFISFGGRGYCKLGQYIELPIVMGNQFIPRIYIFLTIHSFLRLLYSISIRLLSWTEQFVFYLLFAIAPRQKACQYPTLLLLKGGFLNKYQ